MRRAIFFFPCHRVLRSNSGFDVDRVAYFRMKPRLSGYDQQKASAYFRRLQQHLESLGEVESVAFVRFPPTLPVTVVDAESADSPAVVSTRAETA